MLLKAKQYFNFWNNWKIVKLKTWEIWECEYNNYLSIKTSYFEKIEAMPLIAIAKKQVYFEWVDYIKDDYIEIQVNNFSRYNQIKNWYKESFRFIENLKDYEEIKNLYFWKEGTKELKPNNKTKK